MGTSRPGWRGALVSLHQREFKWIFTSNLAFFFAMNGQMLVRSKLAYDLTGSAVALGIVNLAVSLPMLIISPFGGVVADRFERRRLIVGGQAMLLLNEIAVFALLLLGVLQFWHLCVAAVVMGCMFPFIMPARQAIVANVVGKEGLANAMALQMGAMNCARVAGPVTAGFILAEAGTNTAYAVAIVLYLVALVAMAQIRRAPAPDRVEQKSVFSDLAAGVKYVNSDKSVRALLVLSIVPILLAMPFQALLVVFADDVWHVGDFGFGLLQAFAGIGGILGSIFVAVRGDSPRRLRLMMASLLAFGGTLFLFAMSPWFLLALPLVLISDVFASTFNTVNNTAIQLIIPDEVRGRVMSLMMMSFGLTPLGTLPVSAAAQAWGAPVAVAGAASIMVLATLAMFWLSPALRGVDAAGSAAIRTHLEPVAQRVEPAAAAS